MQIEEPAADLNVRMAVFGVGHFCITVGAIARKPAPTDGKQGFYTVGELRQTHRGERRSSYGMMLGPARD